MNISAGIRRNCLRGGALVVRRLGNEIGAEGLQLARAVDIAGFGVSAAAGANVRLPDR